MCLLDEVIEWSAARVVCRSATHHAPDNPLRSEGRLGAVCGLEYAAQAMAVHGALLADFESVEAGYLASVRSLELYSRHLDELAADLLVEAERISGDSRCVLYRFSIASAGRVLLLGRATVVFGL
jgi:predicted hotdog family 3-hydroxylacyl-ACP dehydratase